MYKCASCGMVFEETVKLKFPLCRIDGQQYYDPDYVCPFCGSDDIDYVEECEKCGEYFYEDELADDERVICKECAGLEHSPYHGCNTAMEAVFKMLEV